MSQVRSVTGCGMPLKGNDIDTDRIIPARYLRCVTFDGLGKQVFADDRTQAKGSHAFDQPQYQDAEILIVNRNFGCGSSREHAPQAIHRWGINALIGESFAEIFFGNCVAIGVPCVTAAADTVSQLQALIEQDPSQPITIDLEDLRVTCGDFAAPIAMGDGPRQMFLEGSWDASGQLIKQTEAIRQTAQSLPYLSWA
ncbi:MAG: 3-isopropylmalate dehydratase small subunit [Leptolyngbya sp. SIO4C1]|nr:3-isopropylmalate dehydratase small subunit [Leptolyngbya sp. SIO4C1]